MLEKSSNLLDQIIPAIRKHLSKQIPDKIEKLVSEEKNGVKRDNNYLSYVSNFESIRKLEQRIQALEEQNDHLLYFIHSLFTDFPELIKEIIHFELVNETKTPCKIIPEEAFGCTKQERPSLTRRELEVVSLLIKGLCAKEIASLLFISETTVITHKKNLKEKFKAKNTVELISKAMFNLTR
jgi:DNA-binding CsgD family transcriptional regulator